MTSQESPYRTAAELEQLPPARDSLPYLPLSDEEWRSYQEPLMRSLCETGHRNIDAIDSNMHKLHIALGKPRPVLPQVPYLAKWYFVRLMTAVTLPGVDKASGVNPRYTDEQIRIELRNHFIRVCCVMCWQLAVKMEEHTRIRFKVLADVFRDLALTPTDMASVECWILDHLKYRLNAPFIKENEVPLSDTETESDTWSSLGDDFEYMRITSDDTRPLLSDDLACTESMPMDL